MDSYKDYQQLQVLESETVKKLQVYVDLLVKWQKAINLVSRPTLDKVWLRHILDSVQIGTILESIETGRKTQTQNLSILDIGSGAGFPGLVIAICRPDYQVTLVESDQRKCSFMKTVSRETNTSISVQNQRLESYVEEIAGRVKTNDGVRALQTKVAGEREGEHKDESGVTLLDVITARALASLEKLFDYCEPLAQKNPDLHMVFLKGRDVEREIEQAQKLFRFDYDLSQSITEPESYIVHIRHLSRL